MTDKIEVTQADRDCLQAVLEMQRDRPLATWQELFNVSAKIIAKHRLAGERAGMERAAEWQPIETAPKDGTEVLLYYPQQGVWAEHQAVNSFQRFEGRGWDTGRIPTHWQPLSAPPIDATLSASSSCPVCGRTTPHHHPLKGSHDA